MGARRTGPGAYPPQFREPGAACKAARRARARAEGPKALRDAQGRRPDGDPTWRGPWDPIRPAEPASPRRGGARTASSGGRAQRVLPHRRGSRRRGSRRGRAARFPDRGGRGAGDAGLAPEGGAPPRRRLEHGGEAGGGGSGGERQAEGACDRRRTRSAADDRGGPSRGVYGQCHPPRSFFHHDLGDGGGAGGVDVGGGGTRAVVRVGAAGGPAGGPGVGGETAGDEAR